MITLQTNNMVSYNEYFFFANKNTGTVSLFDEQKYYIKS